MSRRVLVVGPPRAGKSTYARKLRDEGIPTYCTDPRDKAPEVEDGVTYLPDELSDRWSAGADYVAEEWLTMPGPWCIEGVAAIRALRKALRSNRDILSGVDVVYLHQRPDAVTKPGQVAMGKAVETIWKDTEPSLRRSVNASRPQSMASRRDYALALRKHSLDLVPADAYKREPNEAEARLDIQASEAEEGRALEVARVNLGIALALQAEDVVAMVESPRFSLRTSTIRPDTVDVETAFARLTTTAHFDAAHGYHRDMRRAEPDRVLPESYGLSAQGTEETIQLGLSLGRQFARAVLVGVQKVLDQALSSGMSTADTVRGVRASYATVLQVAEFPSGLRILAAQVEPRAAKPKAANRRPGRRMKVTDRAQHEQWQKEFLPFSKRMRQTVESYQAEASHVPRLNPEKAKEWLATEYTRAASHATILEANADPLVDKLMYSVWKEGLACGLCLKRNGVVRKKDDAWWLANTAPLHNKCMCRVIPLARKEKFKVTPKPDLPDADFELQPGFGGFDPNRVRTMRTLGRAIR